MKTNLDYNEFDQISLVLKKDVMELMLSYYAEFGWREYERYEDKRYIDLVHLTLVRPHRIPNKDKLQLLQVRLEFEVNSLARERRNKHSGSLIVGLTLLVFILSLLGIGIALLFAGAVPEMVAGSVLIALSLAIPAVCIRPYLCKISRERDVFGKRFKKHSAEIVRIIDAARRYSCGTD